MACTLCEKLKNKTKSINNNIMADQNDMVTITNGSQTRKVARIFFEAHCTKTWRIVEEPTEPETTEPETTEPETTEPETTEPEPTEPETTEPEPTEPEPTEPEPTEPEPTEPDLDLEPKPKKKK